MPKTGSAVAKSKKAGDLASSAKSRKAAADATSPFAGHDKLHETQVEAIRRYQGHSFHDINDFLRGMRPSILSNLQADIPRLDRIISKANFTQDVRLYRGTSPIPGVNFGELKPGDTFSDKGFHSTSISKSVAEKFVGVSDYGNPSAFFTVKASKGQKGLAVHKVDTGSKYQAGSDAEYEVLLPRGSTFKVLKVSKRKDGNMHVTVRLQ